MKKTILFAFFAVALSVSCLNTEKWEQEEPDYAEIVTIVDGSYDTPYFVEFDNGQTASVTSNSSGSSITFPSKPEQMLGEVRKLIWYDYDGTPVEGFDKSIKIIAMQDVSSELVKSTKDADVANIVKTHDDAITINNAVYARNRNYLTLEMLIYISSEINYKHSVFVAHNPSREGMFAEVYEMQKETDLDSYLWLELYHDAAGDTTTNEMQMLYSSIKVDSEIIGATSVQNYQGIKIIYKAIENNSSQVFTIDF